MMLDNIHVRNIQALLDKQFIYEIGSNVLVNFQQMVSKARFEVKFL